MEQRKTVTELKLSFIRDQVRTLTASLTPNPDWRDYGPDVEDDISEKVVDDVLQKLNNVLRQHHRVVFSTQVTHHVVQQIERLYWNAINPELHENSTQLFERGSDFSDSKNIARLPEEWPDRSADEAGQARLDVRCPLQFELTADIATARYRALRERLVELDTRRTQRQQKLAQYKRLKALFEPFNGPQTNIQPNLATRDGQLSEELDRMRMLVARVVGRVSEAEKNVFTSEKETTSSADYASKLSALLDMT